MGLRRGVLDTSRPNQGSARGELPGGLRALSRRGHGALAAALRGLSPALVCVQPGRRAGLRDHRGRRVDPALRRAHGAHHRAQRLPRRRGRARRRRGDPRRGRPRGRGWSRATSPSPPTGATRSPAWRARRCSASSTSTAHRATLDVGAAVTDLDLSPDGTFALAVLRERVARCCGIPLPQGFMSPETLRTIDLTGELVGSVTIAPTAPGRWATPPPRPERAVEMLDLAGDGRPGGAAPAQDRARRGLRARLAQRAHRARPGGGLAHRARHRPRDPDRPLLRLLAL
jgi:hypothetical protein